MAKDRKKLVHIHSKITDKQPRPEALEVGEIAVNNGVSGSTDRSFLSIKNADNKVVRFSSDEQMIFWTEKKEVIPFEGQVRGEDGPESTKDSGDYGSYGITNDDLLNNKSNLVIKFNQVAASNTPKSEVINGGKDIYGKLVNGTPDASREGAGIAVDMSRYAMRGANPSFSSLTITNGTTLEGDLNVSGNTKIGNGLNVTGATNINGATKITGDTTFNGNETVNGNLTVTGNTNISGDTRIKNTLTVDGATQINNNLTVTGDTNISGNTRIDKNLTVSGNTNVSGDTNVGNNLKVTNGITADTVSATTSIKSPTISGTDITASNSVKADNVSANTITAATSVTTKDLNVSGNAKITGTTDIAGATTINNALTVNGETLLKNTTVDGSLLVNSGATIHNGISVDGGANITGNTNLNGNLTVTGDTSLKATTATSISATSVTAPTISGTDITASNSVKTNNVSANTITAATSVTTKDLDVSGNGKINNLSAGTLTVSGDTNLKGDVTIDGKTIFNGEVEFEEPIKFESACPQKITATTIGEAICEAFDRSVITIEKNTSPSDTRLATVYTIKQNGSAINTIEVAKDEFLKDAEVVKNTSGEWVIRLTWWIYDPDSGTHTTATTDVNASELVKDLEAVNPDDNGTALNHNVKLTAWYDSTSGDMKISGETTPNMHVANITATTAMRANNVSANTITASTSVTAPTISGTNITASAAMRANNVSANTISANTIYGSVVGGLSNSITFNTGNTNIEGSPFNGLNSCTITIPKTPQNVGLGNLTIQKDGTEFGVYSGATKTINITNSVLTIDYDVDVRTKTDTSYNTSSNATVSIPGQFEHLKNYDGTKFNLSHPVSITGNVSVTGEITASGAIYSSDRDLKENIQFIGIDDINKIKNVPTRSFNFKDDTSKRKTYGVIAQEVQDANLNELVHVKDDGKLGVDYTSLYALKIAYLENMCNELNGKIVELENKINKLENKD